MPPKRAAFIATVAASIAACAASAQTRTDRPVINFRDPQRQYDTVKVGDFTFSVEHQLRVERPAIATRAVNRLARERLAAIATLPPQYADEFRRVPFFLMYGTRAAAGGHSNGMAYTRKDAPRFHPELDPRWGHSIVVYSAENYSVQSDFWARKAIVHEFAHEFQLVRYPEKYGPIMSAWTHAMSAGLYHNGRDDAGQLHEELYAAVNQLEYFAELSTMFFFGCNYPPHNGQELRRYDPTGWQMVRSVWGVATGARTGSTN
jgi:hypothetical protein